MVLAWIKSWALMRRITMFAEIHHWAGQHYLVRWWALCITEQASKEKQEIPTNKGGAWVTGESQGGTRQWDSRNNSHSDWSRDVEQRRWLVNRRSHRSWWSSAMRASWRTCLRLKWLQVVPWCNQSSKLYETHLLPIVVGELLCLKCGICNLRFARSNKTSKYLILVAETNCSGDDRSSLNQFVEQDACLILNREFSRRLSSSPSTRSEKLLRNLRAVDLSINGVQAVLLVRGEVVNWVEISVLRRELQSWELSSSRLPLR